MRILQINQNYNLGSTGRIMKEIDEIINKSGHQGYMMAAYCNGTSSNLYTISDCLPQHYAIYKNLLIHRIFGTTGYFARNKTKKAIDWIDTIKPDIIHLHNIHGDWINIELLFKYITANNIKVIWTLHDCWAFTGRCSHFINCGCEKWKTGCYSCRNKRVYPYTYFFDFSQKMWKDKKKWFTAVNNMTIVTPSNWLGNFVKHSFLRHYNVITINNGIDLETFKRRYTCSILLEKVRNKKIILGVASTWTKNKGLEDFYTLNSFIDPNEYVIVLVGLNSIQKRNLPQNIIGVERTNSVDELAELYSYSTVFVNATYQDNYPTVNLESIACETPVITYRTGGSVESVPPEVGIIVEQGDVHSLFKAIEQISKNRKFYSNNCRAYAIEHFDKSLRYKEYITEYERIFNY